MTDEHFAEPRLGFALTRPARWQFVPPGWSPARELAADADREEEWSRFGHLPFCGAVRPHASRRHAFATLQVSARPMAMPGPEEAATMLQSIRGILLNQNPQAEILTAVSGARLAGCPANVLRCRFSVPVTVDAERVAMGVISRSYVIFAPRYAFTVGLSSSDANEYYEEADFENIIASIRIDGVA